MQYCNDVSWPLMYFLWGFVISSCHLLFLLFAKSSSVALPEEAGGALALGAATDRSGYVEDSLMSPSRNLRNQTGCDWTISRCDDVLYMVHTQTCPAGAFWGCFLEEGVPVSSHLSQVNLTEFDWYSTIVLWELSRIITSTLWEHIWDTMSWRSGKCDAISCGWQSKQPRFPTQRKRLRITIRCQQSQWPLGILASICGKRCKKSQNPLHKFLRSRLWWQDTWVLPFGQRWSKSCLESHKKPGLQIIYYQM